MDGNHDAEKSGSIKLLPCVRRSYAYVSYRSIFYDHVRHKNYFKRPDASHSRQLPGQWQIIQLQS